MDTGPSTHDESRYYVVKMEFMKITMYMTQRSGETERNIRHQIMTEKDPARV